MKLLWIKTDYLHPTTRGGQIRSLEMLKRIHAQAEVDYLTLEDSANPEGPRRAHEYCRRHFAVPHYTAEKRSAAFAWELAAGLFQKLPVAVERWRSRELGIKAAEWRRQENYDAVVCDFLMPAASLDHWESLTLFQHNVESQIWDRHVEQSPDVLRRWYMQRQAERMRAFERAVVNSVRQVITVSPQDSTLTQKLYGRAEVPWVPTGVDTEYFAPPKSSAPKADLVFVGSMDWLPNIDGVAWLKEAILPLIWKERPQTTLALAGRKPGESISALSADPRIIVTGTVEDIRPWLHGAAVSIVPLRIGGGTRLKIYEAMAAGVPTVSTEIGAEGLAVTHQETILIANQAEEFAGACLRLLFAEDERQRISQAALRLVRENFSWDSVANRFLALVKQS